MAGIIGEVIQEFKSILSKMEQAVKDTISEIGVYSQEAERRIEFVLTDAFRSIKKDISDIIQRLEDKLNALEKKKIPTSAGSAATSFPHRLKNGLTAAAKEAEKLIGDFRTEAKFFIEECRKVVTKIGATMEKATVDTVDAMRKAGEDLFHALDTAGKDALSKVEQLSSSVSKHVELDADFAFHHGVQVAEAATIAVASPVFIGCVAVAGLAIVGASHWEPTPEIIT